MGATRAQQSSATQATVIGGTLAGGDSDERRLGTWARQELEAHHSSQPRTIVSVLNHNEWPIARRMSLQHGHDTPLLVSEDINAVVPSLCWKSISVIQMVQNNLMPNIIHVHYPAPVQYVTAVLTTLPLPRIT